ncbi:hypothetical protein NDU88_007030 [Pleurodeles waltl]|uniref:Uncharacterized protein n=1 Tax=Pleurodeles waltl TaxID=8319 RepID=A0AAV7VNJ0_PLEWA|nr:hypothetical protein NDU88_007028 [Pleurodeles waltl]KAJ1203238.1 hypothetical protein NDU88_007030 [Pleurodeles waltl]
MAAATSKVRLIDPLRRPSVPASSALSSSVPRSEPPPAARLREPTSQAARGRSSSTAPARSPGQPDNAGTFRVPAPPPLWSRRRHTLPGSRSSVRRRRRFRFQAALSPKSTQAIK